MQERVSDHSGCALLRPLRPDEGRSENSCRTRPFSWGLVVSAVLDLLAAALSTDARLSDQDGRHAQGQLGERGGHGHTAAGFDAGAALRLRGVWMRVASPLRAQDGGAAGSAGRGSYVGRWPPDPHHWAPGVSKRSLRPQDRLHMCRRSCFLRQASPDRQRRCCSDCRPRSHPKGCRCHPGEAPR
jgi:hypothetical protein